MGSQPTSVCVCVDGRSHTKHAMCVSEVRRGICESVAGVAWRVRGERGHMGRQRGWWVWWPRRSLTHTHQRGWHHSGRVCVVPPLTLTHSGQGGAAHTVVVVGGKGAQWWWQPHHTHSHHHHVPITPCVCVCESGVDSTSTASEWTKWPHTPQHPRCHHHIHHHHQQQQQEEEWCGVGHKEWVDV